MGNNSAKDKMNPQLHFRPVTEERLHDLAQFSTQHGKFRYCSCMRWRLTSTEFRRSTKEERIAALDDFVCQDVPIGVLGYAEDEPVAWCSVAPRETYAALERSRTLPRIDNASVRSVICFFVNRRFRRQGVTLGLLDAAVEYAHTLGAEIVEGYPVAPGSPSTTYMGAPETFRRAGFHDVTPVGQARQVMHRVIGRELRHFHSEMP
jgi:GNAT superfamily N-acetyltransferase